MMKKFYVAAAILAAFAFSSGAFAQSAELGIKGGTAYAKEAEKVGFNSNLEIGVNVNPYFELLAKPGFVWFSWDKGTGAEKKVGTQTAEVKTNNDAYIFPLLAGAKFKIADAKESIGIIPFASAAVGYSWMKYKYDQPAFTEASSGIPVAAESYKGTFKGLTYEFLGGFEIPLSGTNMSFSLEAGYRGMKLKKDSAEINMSGFVANGGVTFTLGGSSY
jgi:hypothetical protein